MPLQVADTSLAPAPAWHALEVAEVARRLGTSGSAGLSSAEALRRLAVDGPNRLADIQRQPAWRILLRQCADLMVLVLAVAAVLAAVIGEVQDTVAILAILVLNALLGFRQEYRAERTMAALRALATPPVRVRREGQALSVPADELVPGDLVMLEAGNVVPADLRLSATHDLRVDESLLTGESLAVEKAAGTLVTGAPPLADIQNQAWRGTAVVHGRGEGLVVATGMSTELGRIAQLLAQSAPPPTPLQQRLGILGRRLAAAAVVVCAVVLGLGLLRAEPFLPMLLTAVSLAVAAIPESLPAVVTIALALGARRMSQERALVRRLPSVETLGSVTCICADKTGTLTRNRMEVEQWWLPGEEAGSALSPHPSRGPLLRALALCHDVLAGGTGTAVGDPTEVALVAAVRRAGADPEALAAAYPRIAEHAFTAERGAMTTVHRGPGGVVAVTKGSPERILAGCTRMLGAAGPVALDPALVLRETERMAESGLRVLGVAEAEETAPGAPDFAHLESGQLLLGLVGLMDPPRPEAAAAVATCRAAGIRVVMITGDHPTTARAIATRLGILDGGGEVITGHRLSRLSPERLPELTARVRVYARVSPAQKIAIIEALQARGECVAMTGDGINDAPALRRADVGVAMGQGGTDVAREAAPLVLLDDNFATIVTAVRAGRRIYDNIRKFVRYAVTCNAAEVATLLLAPLVGLPLPLLPIHLLWINLVTDGLPGLALAAEPEEATIMRRPPRPPGESIFAGGLWQHVLWVGALMAGVALATEAWAHHAGLAEWQTMTFTVLALSQMGHVMAIRSERASLRTLGLRTNRPLLRAVMLTILLQFAILYIRPLAGIFRTVPLGPRELLLCLAASAVVLGAVEGEKALVRRGLLYRKAEAAG
ncbi:MAG: cation-transporting P-type ATPase [Gemmatimonadales bacterium]